MCRGAALLGFLGIFRHNVRLDQNICNMRVAVRVAMCVAMFVAVRVYVGLFIKGQ